MDSTEQYAHWLALSTAINRTGRPIYLDFCPHAIGDGLGTETKGKLMYAPPKDWSLEQRRALANSLLVEYVCGLARAPDGSARSLERSPSPQRV